MSTNPNTVKSQDDLPTTNDGKRSSDVLLSTIDKIVEVEQWNKDMQTKYGNVSAELEKTKKQLEIAVKALRGVRVWANTGNGGEQAVKKLCDKALKEIEELC